MQRQVLEFHEAFGVHAPTRPEIPPPGVRALRYELIREELEEFKQACDAGDLTECVDAIGDLLYVVFGSAVSFGVNMEPIVDEIHRSNMSKVWPDGSVRKREDGKVEKPATYSPAKLEGLIIAQQTEASE